MKDQMAALGHLLVYTFGGYLAGILVVLHTVNNLDHSDEPENEVYENN